MSTETDVDKSKSYRCAECGETFAVQQAYASHANATGHDVAGTRSDTTRQTRSKPRRGLGRAYRLISDGEVGRLDLLSFAFGSLAGIFLAHEPTILGDLAVTGGIAVTAYRVFLRVSNKEMGLQGIQYLDTFTAGVIFGFVGVTAAHQDMPLDQLAHGFGAHTHH